MMARASSLASIVARMFEYSSATRASALRSSARCESRDCSFFLFTSLRPVMYWPSSSQSFCVRKLWSSQDTSNTGEPFSTLRLTWTPISFSAFAAHPGSPRNPDSLSGGIQPSTPEKRIWSNVRGVGLISSSFAIWRSSCAASSGCSRLSVFISSIFA